MKILFIKTSIGTGFVSYFDMGIALISAVLKRDGHEISYFSLEDWSYKSSLEKRIRDFKPDIVGFTAVGSTFEVIVKISKIVKSIDPKIFCICGGVHVTLCPNDFVPIKSLDAICLGEGEYAMSEFVRAYKKRTRNYLSIDGFWFRDGNKIIKNKKRNLIDINNLPLPDREIFLKEGLLYVPFYGNENVRQLEFIFSRGCPFRCTYCSNHALSDFYGNGYVRFKDPKIAIEEIKDVLKNYRADYLLFHDDLFTLKKEWLKDFLKLYKKRIGLPFECNIRVRVCDREMFGWLKDSGCVLVKMGLESGDEMVREKVLKRRMTNTEIKKTFLMAKKVGLKTFAFIIIGFPGETPTNFKNTIKLVAEVDPDFNAFYIFHPYKGTELYNFCKENRYIIDNIADTFVEREDTILNLSNFKRKDILYFFKNFGMLVYFLKKSKQNNISGWHNKWLYFLCSDPPSSWLYRLKQFLYQIDRMGVFCGYSILGIRKDM